MTDDTNSPPSVNVLLELRPALEGFAGIPQETRLLFRGLRMIDGVDVEGLIQSPVKRLAGGVNPRRTGMTQVRKINRYSRVIVSMGDAPKAGKLWDGIQYAVRSSFKKTVDTTKISVMALLSIGRIRLTRFDARHFEDFIWRTVFAKTLPATDFSLVVGARFRVCRLSWQALHKGALGTRILRTSAAYAAMDTEGVDVFVAQTPYPARVSRGTALVVRYHDAIPVFMPHTIPDKSVHQATHFNALLDNARAGAYFACVSEATRQDLLKLCPDVAERAVTIHNMVSHHYYAEESDAARVPEIIRTRADRLLGSKARSAAGGAEKQIQHSPDSEEPLRYVLMVSTIEPRKNHLSLLAAWEILRATVDSGLKLITVGSLGWDNAAITRAFRPWIDAGHLFCLSEVPAADLRVLYRHAQATVCPSFGEGFDFSGVEAMACGCPVIASDIAVHREIYGDASVYFDPYSVDALVRSIKKVLYEDGAQDLRDTLRSSGSTTAARYRPENILPQWDRFLKRVNDERRD